MEEKTDLFREETDPGAAAAFSGSRVLPIRWFGGSRVGGTGWWYFLPGWWNWQGALAYCGGHAGFCARDGPSAVVVVSRLWCKEKQWCYLSRLDLWYKKICNVHSRVL
jgi:hypothetical protein